MHKEFHIGDVLSVTTGILVSPRLIAGVYDVLNYMTGESVYTHQIPRISQEAGPVLIRQHPWLAEIDLSDVIPDSWRERLDTIIAEHGEMITVEPMTDNEHERIDPLSELAEKVHPDKIVIVQ